MKEKIIYLIIGILIGTIITTSGFFVYNKLIKKTPDMPMNTEGQRGRPNMGNGEEPPARPDENNTEEQSTDSQNTDNNSNT